MRVAVTGASGFIGNALRSELSARGIEPVPLALRAGDTVRLPGVDAVVHLAGMAHRRGASQEELNHANVVLSESVGAAVAAAGRRMIFVSSVKVHGEQAALPLQEGAALVPGEAYARSKARAEQALHAIAGLQLTVLRPPLVYGPCVRANFLALLRAIDRGWPLPFASISNRRSLVYVGNLCSAISECLVSAAAAGRTFFVTDGAAVSTPALCLALGVALRRPVRLFAFPPVLLPIKALKQSLEADDSEIRRELGWRPPFSFEKGLKATADWYRTR